MHDVTPPWTTALTSDQHDLVLYGIVVTALVLMATLVRVRFTQSESHGVYRTASLTANAVVAIAFASYVLLALAFVFAYERQGDMWVPTETADLLWSLRYMDWTVTVPLLVLELLAVSAVPADRIRRYRWVGMSSAAAMVVAGYLGAFVLGDGDGTAFVTMGLISSVFFVVLYALILRVLAISDGRLPAAARPPFRGGILLLLIVWLAYPAVYGLQGSTEGGEWVVAGQLILCAADMIAKVGFGTAIHRTAVLRSRADEEVDPTQPKRPRMPQVDSVWVDPERTISFDRE